ncbi:MAG: translocation/assembly module TamB domain-containing protein [Candidatus Krumholzibacteriota bacterium]|nr:translocation/assembly module TamB domain-containing protein [Candidatus Krumholzibacteriota bacterium]
MGRHLRRSTRIALVVFLGLILAGIALLRWQNQRVAERLATYLTHNLLRERGYALTLASVHGLPGRDLELSGMRVRYEGGARPPFDLLTADRVRVRFDPWSLMRGDFHAEQLTFENAVLRAFAIEAERWAYPGFDPSPGRRSGVIVDLEQVLLRDVKVLREGEGGLDSLRVSEARFRLFRNEAGTALDLERAYVDRAGVPPLDLTGRFFLPADGSLTLAGVGLRLPDSRLRLRGHVDLAGGLAWKLDLAARPLVLRELAVLAGAGIETDGWLEGDLQLEGAGDSLLLAGVVSGELYGYALSGVDVAGLYRDGTLHCRRLAGFVNGSRVDGAADFTLPLSGRAFRMDGETRLTAFDLATFLGGRLRTDLNGWCRLRHDDCGLRFLLELGPGSLDDYSFQELSGDLCLASGILSFRRLELWDEGLDLSVTGRLLTDPYRLDLVGEGTSRSSRLACRFAGDSCLTGRLDFRASFDGPLAGPRFRLDSRLAEVRYLGADLAAGRLELVADSLAAGPLDIHLEGDSLRRAGLRFDRLWLDASLAGERLDLRHVSLDALDLEASLTGSVDLASSPPLAALDRLWVRWRDEEWLSDRPLRLALGAGFRLSPVAWVSSSGRLEAAWGGSEAPDRVAWRDLDLRQFTPWLPASLGAGGRLSGSLQREDGGYRLLTRLDDARLGNAPAGTLALSLLWRGDSLAVDSLQWHLAAGRRLDLRGILRGLPDSQDGLAALGGTTPDGLRHELRLAAAEFPLERLGDPLGLRPRLAGFLSGELALDGSPVDPVLRAEARVDSFSLAGRRFDSIELTGTQAGGRLRVSRLALRRGASRVAGWLQLPLVLRLGERPRLAGEGALSGDLRLSGRGEDLLGLVDVLAEAGGALEGDLRLGGSPDAPAPSGYLRLRDGQLRFAGWEESLEALNADCLVDGDTLRLLSFHAREGHRWSRNKDGEISGDGWLRWRRPRRYGLHMDFAAATLGTVPYFRGVLSGALDVSTYTAEGAAPHPFLSGNAVIHSGVLEMDFGGTGLGGGGATVDPGLSYALALRADNSVFLRNEEADLELSGELNLARSPAGTSVSGELQTLRGSYTVFGNKFHLVEGWLDFSSAEGLNPKIDILAETRNRDDRIEIHITNTFAEPQVDVVSDHGYGKEDVLRILVGLPVGEEREAGGDVAATVVRGRVESELMTRLERIVAGELAGVVDFELESRNLEEEGGTETRWQIGRYLPGGLYLSYNQGLSLDSDYEVGLEYRLYNRLWLRSEMINRSNQLGEEGLFNEVNFDVRLRWEY